MRVLVVSSDASLAVALSLMSENREVLSVRSAREVSSVRAGSINGTVIDVGTTADGLDVVRELTAVGVGAPFFLLGDVEASAPHPGVHVLVRPFTLEQLDERLSAASPRRQEASDAGFEGPASSPSGVALLREVEGVGRGPAGGGASGEPPQETTPAAKTVGERAVATPEPPVDVEGGEPGTAQLGRSRRDVPTRPAPEEVDRAASPTAGGTHAQARLHLEAVPSPDQPKPEVRPRFRGRTDGPPLGPRVSSTLTLRTVLALAQKLERAVDERPELLDRRASADGFLEEIGRQLRPRAAAVWVPRDDQTYEAYATSGLEGAVGIRLPQEQSLFLRFNADADAVLVTPLDVSQRPVSGIPGLIGESLVASAMRLGQALLAVVVVTGSGYTTTDRDRLAFLASRAAPDFAVAGLIERLRNRTFVPDLATTRRSS